MANIKLIRRCILFLLALSFVLGDIFVGGRSVDAMESKELVKHKGTVKTIEGKNGDVIDCVDINQQPAFDHPLLKNHTIQMEPSFIRKVTNEELYNAQLFQGWHEDEECPKGTIPIRHARPGECSAHRTIAPLAHRKELNIRRNYDSEGHEYAQFHSSPGNYNGAHATINLWSPLTMDGDFSLAQIWVVAGPDNELNTIESGWRADNHNGQPRFFVYWTRDAYGKTGCQNLDCPGFVQVDRKFAIGSPLNPVSSYGGTQHDIAITIYKDKGNWWLQVQNQAIGYWPHSIFTHLANTATSLSWGGEIYSSGKEGHHTSTHMGSGHFPSEGYGKASYFRNIQYIDSNGKFVDAGDQDLHLDTTKSSCYDVALVTDKNGGNGTQFYFGGPGYSATCP